MKVLITGASGFVGGSLFRLLQQKSDYNVLGVARRELHIENYLSADLSQTITIDFTPDVVVHCAAMATPWGKRSEYELHNITATRNVIDFCQRSGNPKLIYISSSSVFYQSGHQFEITEESPIGPDFINHYAETKYAGELLVKEYPASWVILRPRAVFGPRDTVLLPRILDAARKGSLPLFKQKPKAPPVVGDLIYIDVLCDYIFKSINNQDIQGEYNLTNNEPVEIQAFILELLDRLHIPAPTRTINFSTAMRLASLVEFIYRTCRIYSEPPITKFGVEVFGHSKTFDVSKTLRDLGDPICDVSSGVDKVVEWQKNHA